MRLARQYTEDVLSGRIVAGKWTKQACERFQRFLVRAADPTGAFVFSEAHAKAVCQFVERLPHVEGTWSTETIRLEPWQIFILVACYGFRIRATGRRLVTVDFFRLAGKVRSQR